MEGADDLQRDYEEIYLCCMTRKRAEYTERKWQEILSRSEKSHVDKLLHRAVTCLSVKLSFEKERFQESVPCIGSGGSVQCPDMEKALRACYTEARVVDIMSRDADLSAVDDKGKMPVDHIFSQLIGYKPNSPSIIEEALIGGKECCFPEPEDGMTMNLLEMLIDKSVLNAPCMWGYSYFSMFILLKWWSVVIWGLECGADVSDNGVCQHLPIAAVFDRKFYCFSTQWDVPNEIFERLLHWTNVNRPISIFEKPWLPLHLVSSYMFGYHDMIPLLLDAGAEIDRGNDDDGNQLPMEIYAAAVNVEVDPVLFRRMVPRSMGIPPTLFLKLLGNWKEGFKFEHLHRTMELEDFFKTIFCEHLRFSSGWHDLRVFQGINDTPGKITLAVDNQFELKACLCGIVAIIDALTKFGIRARSMPECLTDSRHDVLKPGNISSLHVQKFEELKDKWNEYRSFVPSLRLQSVRVIRSCLPIATDEHVQKLPIPKPLREVITYKDSMEEILSDVKYCK